MSYYVYISLITYFITVLYKIMAQNETYNKA